MDIEIAVGNLIQVGESAAYKKVRRMIELTLLKKSVAGLYTFNGKTE